MVELNVGALHDLCVALVLPMVRHGAGAVLNVGSTAGFQPLPTNATYSGTNDGKRVVVPGAVMKAAAVAGRFTPRSVLLPLARRFAPGG